MALCHGPVDKLVRIRVGGNTAWVGNHTGGALQIDKPKLFGGEKREGGVSGQVDIEMGGPAQGQNSYLAAKLGADLLPAFRGVCCAVLRQVYIGLNPYLKDWAWFCQRVFVRSGGAAQWYPAKAAINSYGAEDHIQPVYEEKTASLNDYTLIIPSGSLDGVYAVSGFGIKHDPIKQNGGTAYAVWNGTLGDWVVGEISFSFTLNNVRTDRDVAVFILTNASGDIISVFEPYPGYSGNGCPRFAGTYLASERLVVGTTYRFTVVDTGSGLVATLRVALDSIIGSVNILGSLSAVKGYKFGFQSSGVFSDTGSVTYGLVSIYQYRGEPGADYYGEGADMNPAHIIRECLTDANWGLGYPESDIDDASFAAAADVLFSEGMGISMLWSSQMPIEDFVDEIKRHIDAAVYVDLKTGKFVLKLIRDDYDESSLLVLDQSNISRIEGYSKQTLAELVNEITLSYDSNETGQVETVTLQNLAMIQQQGAIIPASVEYMGFANQAIAVKVAARDLKAMSTPLVTATIYAQRDAAVLNIGSVFRWNWTETDEDGNGIATSYIMRVTEIAFGDGVDNTVRIQCAQDVFALPDITYVEAEPTEWSTPSELPAPASPRLVTEMPYYELVRSLGETDANARISGLPDIGFVSVSAGRQGSEINAALYVDAGAGYADGGTLDFAPTAVLGSALTKAATSATITDAVDFDDDVVGYLAQIDDEIVLISGISGNTVTIQRGCLDTVPSAHLAGAAVILRDIFAASDGVEYVASDELQVQIITSSGAGDLAAYDAPVDSVTMESRAVRPYRPANLTVNGDAYPADGDVYTLPVTIAWAHRNRLQETGGNVLAWTDASVTPEDGTTYTIEALAIDSLGSVGVSVIDETGISGTSRTIEAAEIESANPYGLLIYVGAVRDGYESWQRGSIRFSLPAPGLFSYTDTFDTLNASFWQSVGLSSLTVTDGKLVPMSNQSTWGAWASNYVKWLGERPKNFETQIDLAWEEAGNANMGEVLFWIELSNGNFCYFGLVDDGADTKGHTRYSHPAIPAGVAYESNVDYVSSRTIKWRLLDGVISLYVGGALVFTSIVGNASPSKIGLGHTRYMTYAAIVAKWDNFSIQALTSELLGDVHTFDGGFNASLWDLTKMASATVANEYLSFIGLASTWQNYVGSMVEFLGAKPSGDCEIEAQFGWVYGASCLGELFLYVSTSAANYKVGMYDEGTHLLGSLQAFIPGATSSRLTDQPDKGTATVKLVISGATVSAYANGILLCSGTFDGGAITKIGLTNTRYSTYNGVTTRLYYLRIREL